MTFLSKRRAFRVDNLLNKIAGAGADIVINATNVFAQQSHTDELRADEGKQNGKEHKYAFRRPLRSQRQAKYKMMRDTPQSCGLPPIEEYKNDYPDDYNEKAEEELTAKQIFMQYVLPNKLLWYIAIANVFVYLLRYGILDWSPTYLKEVKHFALDKSSWAYFLYEYAGIPGTLLCGWMSDKVFRGNRGATGVFFMTLVTIATIVYWMNPAGNPNVDMACMIIIGFLIYGPVMLIGLHALELAPKKAAGTAAGFTGLFGYLGGSVAASAIVGYTVDFFGWDGGFMVMIGGSILAVILLVVVMIGEKRHHDELQLKRNGG